MNTPPIPESKGGDVQMTGTHEAPLTRPEQPKEPSRGDSNKCKHGKALDNPCIECDEEPKDYITLSDSHELQQHIETFERWMASVNHSGLLAAKMNFKSIADAAKQSRELRDIAKNHQDARAKMAEENINLRVENGELRQQLRAKDELVERLVKTMKEWAFGNAHHNNCDCNLCKEVSLAREQGYGKK